MIDTDNQDALVDELRAARARHQELIREADAAGGVGPAAEALHESCYRISALERRLADARGTYSHP